MYGSPIYYEYHLISFLSPLLEGKMKEWINLPVYGINYKTKKKEREEKRRKTWAIITMLSLHETLRSWRTSPQLFYYHQNVFFSFHSPAFFVSSSISFSLFHFFLISGFHAKRFLTTTSLIPLMRYPSGHHTADDFIILFLLFVEHCSINCYYY